MNTPNHAIKYIQGRPYEVQQVIADDGSLVWIESGINPDKVFGDKRTSNHPYSRVLAHMICEKIALGQTLTSVCKLPGFPSYNIVCQWRRENPEFNEELEWAYKDRRDLIEESLVLEARELGDSTAALRLRFKIIQWHIDKMTLKGVKPRKEELNYAFQVYTGIPGREPIDMISESPILAPSPEEITIES